MIKQGHTHPPLFCADDVDRRIIPRRLLPAIMQRNVRGRPRTQRQGREEGPSIFLDRIPNAFVTTLELLPDLAQCLTEPFAGLLELRVTGKLRNLA